MPYLMQLGNVSLVSMMLHIINSLEHLVMVGTLERRLVQKVYSQFNVFEYFLNRKDTNPELFSCTMEERRETGFGWEIQFDEISGFFRVYVDVPRRHTLFGKNYSENNLSDCTYSELSPFRGQWWRFGWDYYSKCYISIARIYKLLDNVEYVSPYMANMFISISPMSDISHYLENMEVITIGGLKRDILKHIQQLKDIHFQLSGSPYSARPLSSHKNSRCRRRWAKRVLRTGYPLERMLHRNSVVAQEVANSLNM